LITSQEEKSWRWTRGDGICAPDVRIAGCAGICTRAVDAGAKPGIPLANTFWGDHYGCVLDPCGYIWALSMVKEVLTPEQVQQRMEEIFAKMGHGDCGPIAE